MKKMNVIPPRESGSTLMVVIAVTASILALLGVAVEYTSQISRVSERSRQSAVAMEIADGHLEMLFTQWRNIYRTTWSTQYGSYVGATDTSMCPTNYFYTTRYSPAPAPSPLLYMSPAATPPVIPTPAPSHFSTSNYTLGQYRIQAVDPMITLDANENALVEGGTQKKGNSAAYSALSPAVVPPFGYGPNLYQYSLYYLAAADVTVPTLRGNVTAKVRRVFEKKFDQPWTYAMFYVDDLELHPTTPLTITGPIHTNGGLYIGTSNFTAGGLVEYGSDFVNGYSPNDNQHADTPTVPNFAKSKATLAISDCPPSQVSPYLPFGWNLSLHSGTGNGNDDGYHEVIETPVAGQSDPLKNARYYLQTGYQVVIAANNGAGNNGAYTVTSVAYPTSATPSPTPTAVSGTVSSKLVGNNGVGNSATVFNQGRALWDTREGGAVKVTDVDISVLIANLSSFPNWSGVLYLSDKGAATYNADGSVKTAGTAATVTINGTNYSTTKRAFRIVKASAIPKELGLTIVSENPVYIQGDFNTGGTIDNSGNPVLIPASNSSTPNYNSPTVSNYFQTNSSGTALTPNRKPPAAIIADSITVLSPRWDDSKSVLGIGNRTATHNVTINAALVSGNVPSSVAANRYSGGGENFIRLLEDWSSRSFCYYGSMVQLYRSNQAIGAWLGNDSVYKAPQTTRWFYDDVTFSNTSPPGNLSVAAYLQQQRWYQVF